MTVENASGQVAAVTVGGDSSLLLHNGVSVAEPVRGLGTITRQILHRTATASSQAPQELVALGTGGYFATPRGLASHIITFSKPAYPGTIAHVMSAQLKIRIDETGRVVSQQSLEGDALALAACSRSIKNWQFRPFVAAGAPVRVDAHVIFWFGADGSVTSPIITEMAR